MPRHQPLSDAQIAELRAVCQAGSGVLERYASQLVLDLLDVRRELHRERERTFMEIERLHDLLSRMRPRLAAGFLDDELRSLLDEIEDALSRRLR